MQSIPSNKAPRRATPWIGLVVLTVAACAALLWFLRPARPVPARRSGAPASTAPGSYRNRSVIPRPAGAPAEPAATTIRGSVYDDEGKLLPGVSVVATTFDIAGNMPSPVGAARTDSGGQFVIPLAKGTYQITAALAGHGTTAALAQAGEDVTLVLYPSGVIQGHVKDDRGQPVRRFTIDLVYVSPGDAPAPPPAWSKAFESEDGAYRVDEVPIWPVMVRAVADDKAPAFSPPLSVQKGQTRDVDLSLGEGCTLTGKVVDRRGNPLPRVLVNAEERMTSGSMTDPSMQTATQAQSADDGSFSLDHVPTGTLLVRGYDGDYAVTTATVKVGDCAKLTPVTLTMSSGGAIAGTVLQADGKPVPGALVSITDRATGYVNATTDAAGKFRLDAIPTGNTRLEMEHKGQHVIRSVSVKDGETTQVDIALFAAGTGAIKGRVHAGDKPIGGAHLLVASNHEEGMAMYFLSAGADGTFDVPSLPAGQYIITALGARASSGIQVSDGQTTNVNLDVGLPPPVAARERAARRMPPAMGQQAAPSPDAPTPSP